jgi:ATP-dependent Clp protease ATP-binding subunit ClpC
VIFEEIEKADTALYDLLLQILERGELTTGRGVDLTFKNCFVMTSNVCAKEIDNITRNEVVGFGPPPRKLQEIDPEAADARIRAACMGAVEDFFSPEFINRIDEIVTFNPLKYYDLMAILEKFLTESRARVAMAGLTMSVADSAKHFLIDKGTNLRYGARPLRRAVREYLEFPIANLIAERDMSGRNQAVHVEAGTGILNFYFARLARGGDFAAAN